MHATIAKQGFAVIVAFCYNICLFRTPVLTILKVVGCECARENALPLWGPGGEVPGRQAILAMFSENSHFEAIWMTFCTFLDQLEKAKLLRFGRV